MNMQVQESWAIVSQDLDTHGIKFFLKIFEIAPPALELFSFKGLWHTGVLSLSQRETETERERELCSVHGLTFMLFEGASTHKHTHSQSHGFVVSDWHGFVNDWHMPCFHAPIV